MGLKQNFFPITPLLHHSNHPFPFPPAQPGCYLGSVTNIVAGLVGILIATNQVAAASNFVAQTAGIHVSVPDTNDPVELEYKKLLAADDAAQADVDKWIRENEAFAAKGGGVPASELNARIFNRFEPIIK